MDTTERYAWLHHCGELVPGTDETFCPGCRTGVGQPAHVQARYLLTPIGHDDDVRRAVAGALRGLAPGHRAVRIWGRLPGASGEQGQEGNAWAADPEDLAELLLGQMNASL